jgi:GNAT superfamily N-acetyltransferase
VRLRRLTAIPRDHRRCVHNRASSSASASSRIRVARAGAAAVDAGEHPSTAAIARVVNWAYRGKHSDGDALAWTGERHLLSGKRTTADELDAVLERCDAPRPSELLLLALAEDTAGAGNILGTVHVQKLPRPGECEIGMFSVDPDQQGRGVGGLLLRHAETLAVDSFAAHVLVMHVLEGRIEIQSWYERCGYAVATGVPKIPFPFGPDALSAPADGVAKETVKFLRLEKSLHESADSDLDSTPNQSLRDGVVAAGSPPAPGYPFEAYETAAQYEREQAWALACEQKLREDAAAAAHAETETEEAEAEQRQIANGREEASEVERELRNISAAASETETGSGLGSALLQYLRNQPAGSSESLDREELYRVAIDECVMRLARREALELFEVRP